ncbi:MAG: GH36-type glycosyl hydrolase domain-containing protein [Mycoplasmatales bacterium]
MKYANFEIELQPNKLLKNIKLAGVQLNLFKLTNVDTPLTNVHVKKADKYYTLLSNENQVQLAKYENGLVYQGKVADINLEFTVSFKFTKTNTIFVDVELSEALATIFATDIGLGDDNVGDKSTYNSQYIDNKVFADKTIAMRRTSRTATGFPYGQYGSFNQIESYVTEGYDFLGLSYKYDRTIKGLKAKNLVSRARNYELAFAALEIAPSLTSTFYIYVEPNRESAIEQQYPETELKASYTQFEYVGHPLISKIDYETLELVNGIEYSDEEISKLYQVQITKQIIDGQIGSFFTEEHAHVVLPVKEKQTERTHAHIITTGNQTFINDTTFVSSNYMNGVFSAQNAVGNTQFNQLNRNVLSSLYVAKLEGMRFVLQTETGFQLLNMPSVYEMGFNYAKWIYQLADKQIEVVAYTDELAPQLVIKFESTQPVHLFAVDKLMDVMTRDEQVVALKADSFQAQKLPNLKYEYHLENGKFTNAMFGEVNTVIEFEGQTSGQIIIVGSKNELPQARMIDFETAKAKYAAYYESLLGGLKLEVAGLESDNITSYNHLIHWYVHNGLIHFATPHGVEQHGGAAWGTRDVCQGPVELFSSLGRYEEVRAILLRVFDNQFIEDGNWPQWFMFDEYENIRPYDAHGDIIVWPIKALADYLVETNDLSILEEECGYYSYEEKRSEIRETVFEHVVREINYIKANFLEGTHISSYGEGDWDDTLQPANSNLRKYMASGWTVPLTHQAFKTFGQVIANYQPKLSQEVLTIAEKIKNDYQNIMIKDGVAAGFIYREPNREVEYMLHPSDTKTGIKYRLLPINRSIISGVFNEEQIKKHLQIIDEHLLCPDGVRLMDAPAPYVGGVSKIFQRAETASTVGREISLQYVHAHIRYIEAMAKIGAAKRVYNGLNVVSPFNIHNTVKNANIRQANAYYSSSEGDFDNRYQYAEDFYKLKNGDITVKSGWRIYSSGPGIYLKQLISAFLGFKQLNQQQVIDPVICECLDGLTVTKTIAGKQVKIKYKTAQTGCKLNGEQVSFERVSETYRQGGYIIDPTVLNNGDILEIGLK